MSNPTFTMLGGFTTLHHAAVDPGDVDERHLSSECKLLATGSSGPIATPVSEPLSKAASHLASGPSCEPPAVEDGARFQSLLLAVADVLHGRSFPLATYRLGVTGRYTLDVYDARLVELPLRIWNGERPVQSFPPEQAEAAVRRLLELTDGQ